MDLFIIIMIILVVVSVISKNSKVRYTAHHVEKNLEDMSRFELLCIAEELGIDGRFEMNEKGLFNAIKHNRDEPKIVQPKEESIHQIESAATEEVKDSHTSSQSISADPPFIHFIELLEEYLEEANQGIKRYGERLRPNLSHWKDYRDGLLKIKDIYSKSDGTEVLFEELIKYSKSTRFEYKVRTIDTKIEFESGHAEAIRWALQSLVNNMKTAYQADNYVISARMHRLLAVYEKSPFCYTNAMTCMVSTASSYWQSKIFPLREKDYSKVKVGDILKWELNSL